MNATLVEPLFAKQSNLLDEEHRADLKSRFTVRRAAHLGMCFGVRDAIQLAEDQARSGPVTVLGDLVHNETVLSDLRARGILIERRMESVRTPEVIITAHGASERLKTAVQARGHRMTEATCPLVHFAHRSVARLVADGFHPVIIGQRDHVEVRGLTEDLEDFDVILTDEDVERLVPRPKIGVAAQTTQPIERVHRLTTRIRRCFPNSEVRFADTVCQPTKQRQSAAVELARSSDVMVVIGGRGSNNTKELVRTSQRDCSRVYHVQSAADLRDEWFEGARRVGLTAGTSTPDHVIDAVQSALERIAGD